MKLIHKILLVGAVLGLFPRLSQATVIDLTPLINMGFENAPAQGSGNNPKGVDFGGTAYYANSVPVGPLNGWTFGFDGTLDNFWGTNEIEWYTAGQSKSWNPLPLPTSSQFAVELNSDSLRGRIYAQPTLPDLVVGQAYKIDFMLAPERNNPSPTAVNLDLQIQGQDTIFSVPALSGWTAESITFVATSVNPVVRFYDGVYVSGINTNGNNNISLDIGSDEPPMAPEPSSIFALTALCAMMGGQWGWKKVVARQQPC